ncbi:MAG: MFS transporter [Lachnospiraceae bacterium]|nr:MFS transporter [Lachnospiraceae bacterium]
MEPVSTKTGGKAPLFTIPFITVVILYMLDGGIGMMTTSLVTEYARTLGADLKLASTAAGLMSLASLFVCPFAGVISDRIDRKRLLIYINIGYGICLILHFFVKSIGMLMALRLLTGVFFSFVSVTCMAYISSFIPKERMGEGMGYAAMASVLSQAFGPGIGFAIADNVSYRAAFLVAGLIAFGCILGYLLVPYHEEPKPKVQKGQFRLSNLFAVEFTSFMLLAAIFSAGNSLVTTYLKSIAAERGIERIALFYTLYSVVMIVLKPISGKLQDRFGVYPILIPSVFFAAAGMALIGIGGSLPFFLGAAVCKAFGQGNGTPSVQANAVKALDRSRAGVAVSTIQIGQNIGNALAPIIGGFVVTRFGYEATFVGDGVLILAAGLFLVTLQYMQEKKRKVSV